MNNINTEKLDEKIRELEEKQEELYDMLGHMESATKEHIHDAKITGINAELRQLKELRDKAKNTSSNSPNTQTC